MEILKNIALCLVYMESIFFSMFLIGVTCNSAFKAWMGVYNKSTWFVDYIKFRKEYERNKNN